MTNHFHGNVNLSSQQIKWLTAAIESKIRSLDEKLLSSDHQKYPGNPSHSIYLNMQDLICNEIESLPMEQKHHLRDKKGNYLTEWNCWKLFYRSGKAEKGSLQIRKRQFAVWSLFAYGEILQEVPMPIEPSEVFFSPLPGELANGIAKSELEVEPSLNIEHVKKLFENSEREIWILDTYIESWVFIKEGLMKAFQKGCRIRILVGHPNSRMVGLRGEGLQKRRQISELAWGYLEEAYSDVASWEGTGKVEFKVFDQLPGMSIFRGDAWSYCGWFLFGKVAMNGPYLKVMPNHLLHVSLVKHLRGLWNHPDSKGIDSEFFPIRQQNPKEDQLAPYLGTWYLYCNRGRQEADESLLANPDLDVVARNILRIKQSGNGQYACEFESSYLAAHQGEVQISENPSFFECKLINGKKHSALRFLIHKGMGIQNHLIGLFNSMYPEEPFLGTGIVALVRCKEEQPQASMVNGQDPNLSPQEKQLYRYLISKHGSRLELVRDLPELRRLDNFKDACKFQGVYKIYAYYKKRGEEVRYISQGVLEISEHFTIRHKRQHPVDPEVEVISQGKAEQIGVDHLMISLKKVKSTSTGVFFLTTLNRKPAKSTYYTGIYAGIASTKNTAVGSRIALAYQGPPGKTFDEIDPQLIQMYSPEYNALPKGVIKTFTGRVNNLIGFLYRSGISSDKELASEARKGIYMHLLFFQSACFLAMEPKTHYLSVKMIQRAFHHGFEDLSVYEDQINEWVKAGILTKEAKEDLLNQEEYLELKQEAKLQGLG